MASVLDARLGVPRQLPQLARYRRDRHHGGRQRLSSKFGTLHCGTAPGGPCNEYSGIGSGQRACSGCQTAFHTYRMEYDRSVSPEQIRWYLDGVNFFTVYSNQVDPTTWNNAPHHGFFVIFDLAMGGGFPYALAGGSTPTASTTSGVLMLVNYIRVYTLHH